MSARSEILRRKYLLRKRIVEARLLLPHEAAFRLIGPDGAYHLYRFHRNSKDY